MDSSQIAKIVASDMSVSDKIRALAAEGYPRADIARALGKRYQHVRNVLEGDKLREKFASGRASGVEEPQRRFRESVRVRDVEDRGKGVYRLAVREDGSVVIPAAVLETLGLAAGGGVIAELKRDEFKLISRMTALKRAQDLLRPYMKEGVSWADELIAERRREAEREASGG